MPGFNLEDYEPVAARIERFWADHPGGRILTQQIDGNGQAFTFRAAVYRADDAEPMATGWAREVAGEGNVNRTSALENCETSAIGRALANAGYSTSKARASREEMAKATETITADQVQRLTQMLTELGDYPPEWVALNLPNRRNIASLPAQQHPQAITILTAALGDARGASPEGGDEAAPMPTEPIGADGQDGEAPSLLVGAEASSPSSALPEGWRDLKYRELSALAQQHGIKGSGSYEALLERLEDYELSLPF